MYFGWYVFSVLWDYVWGLIWSFILVYAQHFCFRPCQRHLFWAHFYKGSRFSSYVSENTMEDRLPVKDDLFCLASIQQQESYVGKSEKEMLAWAQPMPYMRVKRGDKSAYVLSMHLYTRNLVWACFFIWFSSRCLRFCACNLSMVDFSMWNMSPPSHHHVMVCLEVAEPQNFQWFQGLFHIHPALYLLLLRLYFWEPGIASYICNRPIFFAIYVSPYGDILFWYVFLCSHWAFCTILLTRSVIDNYFCNHFWLLYWRNINYTAFSSEKNK